MKEHGGSDSLAGRISLLTRETSTNSFARKCGISEGSVRQYLTGTIPRLDKVIAMAGAAGVRLEWLALGKGPMLNSAPDTTRRIDEALLAQILANVMETRSSGNTPGTAAEIGRMVAEIYDIVCVLDLRDESERQAAIRYALERERRAHCGLSMPPEPAAP